MITRSDLQAAARHNWSVNQGVDFSEPGDLQVMHDIGYDTPETLPVTIERVLGETASGHRRGLELVTEDHVPHPDAPRAAKLRERPPARTPKAKADRDNGEGLRHKTPPEWTPHLTVVPSPAPRINKG